MFDHQISTDKRNLWLYSILRIPSLLYYHSPSLLMSSASNFGPSLKKALQSWVPRETFALLAKKYDCAAAATLSSQKPTTTNFLSYSNFFSPNPPHSPQCVKTHVFVQKFIFKKVLLVNLFEFLCRKSELLDPQMHEIFGFSSQKSRFWDKDCILEIEEYSFWSNF